MVACRYVWLELIRFFQRHLHLFPLFAPGHSPRLLRRCRPRRGLLETLRISRPVGSFDPSVELTKGSTMILKGLTWLVLLQLLGSVVNLLLLPALPGPIIGMVLLFGMLLVRRGIPESLEKTAALLLQYLPLLLIVPAAGIMTSSDALLGDLPAIAAGLVLSLVITVPFCGWLMQVLIHRMDRRKEDKA